MLVRLAVAVCSFMFCLCAAASDCVEPNTQLLPEAGQWMYACGQWEVRTMYRDDNGEMQQAVRIAEVDVQYLADGLTVQSIFRIGEDFFSIQIRAYDKAQKKWISNFVNSKRQRWATTESRWIEGEMVTLNLRGYSNSEPFMTREIETEISADRYVKRISRSDDLGATWGPVLYEMEFTRKGRIDRE